VKPSAGVFGALVLLVACGGDSGTSPSPGASPTPSACAAGLPVAGIPAMGARLVVSGLRQPLDLQSVAGDAERLYVVEQGGRIRLVRNGQLQAAAFLDVSARISTGGERGLLGLAFHPQFTANRRFFVNYTNPRGDTHIAEFHATSADAADPASERVLLVVQQPFSNHNGGGLAFDNSGRLLVALGDGGSGGDPQNHGQRLDSLLGKILRLDVDGALRRAGRQPVPADAGRAGRDLGLRPAQPVQDRGRPPERRPLHRRRRSEPHRGDRRRPRLAPRRRELRLAAHRGHAVLLPRERL
jgi:glucose/arabinose dehydrogenase